MAIRIEYLLVILIGVLLISIMGINPISKEAISSKGEKELAFENFFLSDIKQNAAAQEMFSKEMVKYQNYLEMSEIDLKDEKGYRLLSNKAIYEGDYVYMDKGVNVLHEDGLKLTTKSLNYNLETKEIKTIKPFLLEFNRSTVHGENLALNIENKSISADKIQAFIYFVPDEE